MKKITSTVRYPVPDWNFCNYNQFDYDGSRSKQTCRFCEVSRSGTRCLLYDKLLSVKGDLISKTEECCRATAGFKSTIGNDPDVPVIPPKELMKSTIEQYTKSLNALIKQGYPRPLAEVAAKKHTLGD